MKAAADRLARRNILFQSVDSGIFMAGMVFFHQMTILVVLIRRLDRSPVLVGLIPALLFIGYNLPGLLTTRLAERFPFRKGFIAVCGFIQRLFVLGMALVVFLLPVIGPSATAVLILLFYMGFAVMGGVYNPAWIDFCAKTIPANYRGRVNAFRALIAGAGGIAAPLVIDALLSGVAFPLNYQITILCGAGLLFLSFASFLLIREIDPSPPVKGKSLRGYFGSLGAVLKGDRNFVFFLAAQVVLSVSEAGAAFFTPFALDRLGVAEGAVVLYTFLYNASFLAFGFLIGVAADRIGSLNVLRIGALGTCLTLLLVFLIPSPATMGVVFVLVGLTFNARLNSFQVFITHFGDGESRIRYSTLAAGIGAASFGLMPLLGGILIDVLRVDYTALFAIGAIAALAAFLLFLFAVKNPGAPTARAGRPA